MSDPLFLPPLWQIGIPIHQILDDAHHLNYEFPIPILLFPGLLNFGRVLVKAFLTVCLCPCKGLFKLFFIVYFLTHTADQFHFVYGFHPHPEIFLNKCRVYDGTSNSHADRTYLEI